MNEIFTPLQITLPLTLEGSVVRLEPVRRGHADLFWDVAKNDLEDIFRWIPYAMNTREDFEELIDKAFAEQERGESVVFATVEHHSGRVIGSTRFMNIDRVNKRVEIGSTWIAPAWQRTTVNTEAKFLMLRHAFEVWGCIRGGVEDRRAQSNVAQCDPTDWGQRRRNAAQTFDDIDQPRARYGVLQHFGHRVARGKNPARIEVRSEEERRPRLKKYQAYEGLDP